MPSSSKDNVKPSYAKRVSNRTKPEETGSTRKSPAEIFRELSADPEFKEMSKRVGLDYRIAEAMRYELKELGHDIEIETVYEMVQRSLAKIRNAADKNNAVHTSSTRR